MLKKINRNASINPAVEQLLAVDLPIPFNEHCFLMLNCAAFVRKTEWEGMPSLQAFEYYLALLSLPSYPISLGISSAVLAEVKRVILDLIEFQKLFANNDLNGVMAKIELHDVTYLPSGYCGTENIPGHFAGLKLRKLLDGRHACSFIDQGAGLEFHRDIAIAGKKTKPDYESQEYAIDLKRAGGKAFLEIIMMLLTDRRVYDQAKDGAARSNRTTLRPYSAIDLHALLICYGEPILATQASPEKAVIPMRGGTCPMTNTKAIVRDFLISCHRLIVAEIKRFHFALKQISCISGYQYYLKNLCRAKHLTAAMRAYNVRMGKHYPDILTDAEFALSSDIAEVIDQRLYLNQKKLLRDLSEPLALPPLRGEWRKHVEEVPLVERHHEKHTPFTIKPDAKIVILDTRIPLHGRMLSFLIENE